MFRAKATLIILASFEQLRKPLIALFLVAGLAGLSHAEVPAPPPQPTLPIEIYVFNIQNYEQNQGIDYKFKGEPVGLGNFQNSRNQIQVARITATPDFLILSDLRYAFHADSWIYTAKKDWLYDFELRCENVELTFAAPEIKIALPTDFSTELEFRDGKTKFLSFDTQFNPLAAIDPTLFSPTSLDQRLRLSARCPTEGARDILEKSVRAWIKNFRFRNGDGPADVQTKFREAIQKQLSEQTHLQLPEALQNLTDPKTLHVRVHKLSDSAGYRIRVGEAFLSSGSQKIVELAPRRNQNSEGNGTSLRMALGTSALERLVSSALFSVPAKDGRWYSNNILHVPIETPYRGRDLRPYYPEIRAAEDEQGFSMNVALATCTGQRAAPRLRPWISEDGSQQGLQLRWSFMLELRKAEALIATRRVHVKADIRIQRNGRLVFGGGTWDDTVKEDNCGGIDIIAPEIGASLEWFMNAGGIQEAFDWGFQRILAPRKLTLEVRMLGQAKNRNRRSEADGSPGYWAEALRIDIQNFLPSF